MIDIKPKNFIALLREYERVNRIVKDKWLQISIAIAVLSIVILISFVMLEITRLGNLGKILLPLLLMILVWEIYLLSKNYFDRKLFVILSALLNKNENDKSDLEFIATEKVKVKRISEKYFDISLPEYATEGSSGLDLRAAVDGDVIIPARSYAVIPTNLKVEIPHGYEIQVRPRSGLAAKHGIGLLNSPGTIDSDYRGEIKVILFNFSNEDYVVKRGDRIAQIVLSKVYKAEFIEVEDLNESQRGEGGFGHTGKN